MGVGRICVQRGEREGKCGRVVTAHSPSPPPKGKFSVLGGGGEAKKAFYGPSFLGGGKRFQRTILGLRGEDLYCRHLKLILCKSKANKNPNALNDANTYSVCLVGFFPSLLRGGQSRRERTHKRKREKKRKQFDHPPPFSFPPPIETATAVWHTKKSSGWGDSIHRSDS